MESFFGTLKRELVHHVTYPTRNAARVSLFGYIEVFWPKTPSIPLDGYHERESEGRRLFMMKNAAGGLMQTARSR
jgi:hypothetical protein